MILKNVPVPENGRARNLGPSVHPKNTSPLVQLIARSEALTLWFRSLLQRGATENIPLPPGIGGNAEGDRGSLLLMEAIPSGMQELTTRYDSRLLVLLIPHLGQVQRPSYTAIVSANLPHHLLLLCEKPCIPMLDLTPILKARARQGQVLYYLDEGRWNARGHRQVAQGLAQEIRRLWSNLFISHVESGP